MAAGLQHLADQVTAAPTSMQSLCGIYNIMAVEIMMRSASAAAAQDSEATEEVVQAMEQAYKDAVGLSKFMAGQLLLSKKDVAGKIQTRLDKFMKDHGGVRIKTCYADVCVRTE